MCVDATCTVSDDKTGSELCVCDGVRVEAGVCVSVNYCARGLALF